MAKKSNEQVEGQLELIDVDDPALKDTKRALVAYDKLLTEKKESAAAYREKEEASRDKVLTAIQAAGVSPDANGIYHLSFGGKQWDISQEAQLRIKKHRLKDGDPDDADAE
jgi:hypothetical protein